MENMQASLALAKAKAAAAALQQQQQQQQQQPGGGEGEEEKKPLFRPMRLDAQVGGEEGTEVMEGKEREGGREGLRECWRSQLLPMNRT